MPKCDRGAAQECFSPNRDLPIPARHQLPAGPRVKSGPTAHCAAQNSKLPLDVAREESGLIGIWGFLSLKLEKEEKKRVGRNENVTLRHRASPTGTGTEGAQCLVPEDQRAAETTGFQGMAEQVLGEELCPEDLQRLENACWSVLLKGMEATSAQGPLARERLPAYG